MTKAFLYRLDLTMTHIPYCKKLFLLDDDNNNNSDLQQLFNFYIFTFTYFCL